jgi:hypothetical protein
MWCCHLACCAGERQAAQCARVMCNLHQGLVCCSTDQVSQLACMRVHTHNLYITVSPEDKCSASCVYVPVLVLTEWLPGIAV